MEVIKNEIGIIGLSVMGANLAMNIADHGFRVAVYNRSREKTEQLSKEYEGENMTPFYDLQSFVASLALPRKIILMVQAGEAVDAVIAQLLPILEKGDILVDGGNSYFEDTLRRETELKKQDILFVGMGVSGGEEGARKGPSLMPGGSQGAYELLKPILESIAAKDFAGNPCVTHVGQNAAGHYVKMVHNGIEYMDMQLIAEAYWLMKTVLKMNNEMIAEQFETWNQGRLNSFLIEITAKVLRAQHTDGTSVVDSILDSAGSKGTGKWTSEEILELGVAGFGIVAAVLARSASAQKKSRILLAKRYAKNNQLQTQFTLVQLESALYISKILAYAQGYELMQQAATVYTWQLNFQEISRIWEGGCIIRAKFLTELEKEYLQNPNLVSILLAQKFSQDISKEIENVRTIAQSAIAQQIALPAMLAGISYFDIVTSEKLPANLIQAQRDYFGAHTFQTEIDGPFMHYQW